MTLLLLPQSERSAVFRALVRILKADPIVSSAVKTFLAWEGNPTDAAELVLGMAPALRITPTGGADNWHSPNTTVGPLDLNCDILTAGYDVDDPVNLWRAVIAAFYAPTQTTFAAIQAQLRSAGAYPPSPEFTMPAFLPQAGEGVCFGTAIIRLKVQTQLGSQGVNQP